MRAIEPRQRLDEIADPDQQARAGIAGVDHRIAVRPASAGLGCHCLLSAPVRYRRSTGLLRVKRDRARLVFPFFSNGRRMAASKLVVSRTTVMTRQVSLILRMAALALIVLAFLPAAFAQYAAQVFGSGYARDCYEAVKDRKHDAVKALQTCDVALEQEQISERNRAATHINRGILFMRGGQHDRAMADYRKGLVIAPGMPGAMTRPLR